VCNQARSPWRWPRWGETDGCVLKCGFNMWEGRGQFAQLAHRLHEMVTILF